MCLGQEKKLYIPGGYSLTVSIRVCATQQDLSFWDSDLEQGILKPISRMGLILQMHKSLKISSVTLTIEQGI